MAHISSLGSSPEPISNLSTGLKSGSQKATSSSSSSAPTTDEAPVSPLQAQLTRLSSVLNSLQTGATTARTQYVQAYNQVKAGTYNVNPIDVSRSLVNDLLTNH